MKDEHDFSKAEPGRLYRADAVLVPPVHLEPEVLAFLSAHAAARGVSVSTLVNELLILAQVRRPPSGAGERPKSVRTGRATAVF